MFVVGISYNDCPAEPFIPAFLIVFGFFGLIEAITRLLIWYTGYADETGRAGLFLFVLDVFLGIWWLAGTYHVYESCCYITYTECDDSESSTPPPSNGSEENSDEDDDDDNGCNYCNQVVFLFSFWLVTLSWVAMGLWFLCAPWCVAAADDEVDKHHRPEDRAVEAAWQDQDQDQDQEQ